MNPTYSPTLARLLLAYTPPQTREARMRAWLARNCKPQPTDIGQPPVQQPKAG